MRFSLTHTHTVSPVLEGSHLALKLLTSFVCGKPFIFIKNEIFYFDEKWIFSLVLSQFINSLQPFYIIYYKKISDVGEIYKFVFGVDDSACSGLASILSVVNTINKCGKMFRVHIRINSVTQVGNITSLTKSFDHFFGYRSDTFLWMLTREKC